MFGKVSIIPLRRSKRVSVFMSVHKRLILKFVSLRGWTQEHMEEMDGWKTDGCFICLLVLLLSMKTPLLMIWHRPAEEGCGGKQSG